MLSIQETEGTIFLGSADAWLGSSLLFFICTLYQGIALVLYGFALYRCNSVCLCVTVNCVHPNCAEVGYVLIVFMSP